MATVTRVRLVDDLDGSDADTTVEFGLDGRSYEIDLGDEHATELRELLAPFVAAARRAGAGAGAAAGTRRKRPTTPSTRRPDLPAVREWAMANGFEISARGRLSAAVLEAYDNREDAAPRAASSEEAADTSAPAGPRAVADPFGGQAAS